MTTPNATRVGGEIDAACGKCELNLAHTIIAMVGPKVVKVKCNTCGGEHNYRGVQPLVKIQSYAAPKRASASSSSSSGKPTVKRASASGPAVVVMTWDEQFKGKDLTKARKYSPRETFVVDDVVDHPTFGLGLVRSVRDGKVEVAFKQEDKILVHGKAPPPGAES
jgi:hypothetical protein